MTHRKEFFDHHDKEKAKMRKLVSWIHEVVRSLRHGSRV